MFEYPIDLKKETNGAWSVSCPDVPELHTFGETKDEAIHNANEALEVALSFYVEKWKPLPKASPQGRHRAYAYPSIKAMLKLAIYKAMLDHKVRRVDLAKRLNVAPVQVDRMLDLTNSSRIEQLDAALQAMGQRAIFELEPA